MPSPSLRAIRLTFPAVAFVGMLLTGCREPKVVEYRIPKEKETAADAMPRAAAAAASPAPASNSAPVSSPNPPGANAPATMSNSAVETATGADLVWTAPATWTSKPASAMRKASFSIPAGDTALDLAITAFPGAVGGEVANVNRWRSQLQLAPLSEADVASTFERLNVHGLSVTIVAATNPASSPPQRILGAMIPFGRATWFFKLMGPADVVNQTEPAFREFLQSVKAAPSTP